jgi:hypothetical protein
MLKVIVTMFDTVRHESGLRWRVQNFVTDIMIVWCYYSEECEIEWAWFGDVDFMMRGQQT